MPKMIAWLLVFCALVGMWTRVDAQTLQRPNFIIVIADDMACDDCGAYGRPQVRTPNLDRLAQQGMRFDRAFLTCSSCSPSRASILTGRYPHNTGAEQLHWPVPAEQVMLPELLKASGYWTASAGKWHLGPAVKAKFDKVTEGKVDWVETLRERPKQQPFFMWLASTDPHRPYQKNTIPQPHRPEEVVVPPFLPDVPETRQDLAMYYDEITRLDGKLGEVMAELDRQQIADETFILFMSDNGRPFPRCKTTVYDSGIRTPFIIRWPSRITAGIRCTSLVSSIDIAPTILELAGVERGQTFQGVSFVPLLTDPAATVRPYVFAEHNWHDYCAYDRAVRTLRYKYIKNGYTDLSLSPPADAVRSPTFQAMRKLHDAGKLPPEQMACFIVPRPAEELYDLDVDPDELTNLAALPDMAGQLAEMRAVLTKWQSETRDRMPPERTPDEFDRQTGEALKDFKSARQSRPELRAEQP